jgi:signal transduction histidine kinase
MQVDLSNAAAGAPSVLPSPEPGQHSAAARKPVQHRPAASAVNTLRSDPVPTIPRFRLVRYFSLASAAAIVVVAVALTGWYGWKAEQSLLTQGEKKNAAQVRLILNHLADVERATLLQLVLLKEAPRLEDPLTRRMLELVPRSVAGTSIVKLKLYNRAGLTVFSTELKQIGEDKAGYPGFVAALNGAAASQLSQRERFEGITGTLRQVDLIGSYLPIPDEQGRVVGVVEIYDNVTQLADAIRDARWHVMALSALLLTALYVVLLVVVGRADRILRDKARVLQQEIDKRVKMSEELRRALQSAEAAQRATEQAFASVHAARREAEAANNAKTEFLQTMSESLRTPVNRAIGLIDVLHAGLDRDAQRMQLSAVREYTLGLLDVLSDSLRRLGSGQKAAGTG